MSLWDASIPCGTGFLSFKSYIPFKLRYTGPYTSTLAQCSAHWHVLGISHQICWVSTVTWSWVLLTRELNLNEAISEVSIALIDSGTTKNDTLSHSRCMVCSHFKLLPLLRRAWLLRKVFSSPILSAYSRMLRTVNMSSPMVKRIKPFLTAHVRRSSSLRAILIFNLIPTSLHPLTLLMSSLTIISPTKWASSFIYLLAHVLEYM